METSVLGLLIIVVGAYVLFKVQPMHYLKKGIAMAVSVQEVLAHAGDPVDERALAAVVLQMSEDKLCQSFQEREVLHTLHFLAEMGFLTRSVNTQTGIAHYTRHA